MAHTHTFTEGLSGKVATCACGAFRHLNLTADKIITEQPLKSELIRRQWYRAANPSEATSRRETHYTDMERRQERCRRLAQRYADALRAEKESARWS